MHLMMDVLREALGDSDPTDQKVLAAARNPLDAERLHKRLFDSYRRFKPAPTSRKEAGEFRPAYMLDFGPQFSSPYEWEFNFAARALLYSHSIAVVDDFSRLANAHDWIIDDGSGSVEERFFMSWAGLGLPDCANGTWAARRIAIYGPLEESGLLVYVPKLERNTKHVALQPDQRRSLLVETGTESRYIPSAWQRSVPLNEEWELASLIDLIEMVSSCEDTVDFFLPGWAPFEAIFTWLAKQADLLPAWMPSISQTAQRRYLQLLLSLPTFDPQAFSALDIRDFILVREDSIFERWRTDLETVMKQFDHLSSTNVLGEDVAVNELVKFMRERADRTARDATAIAPFRRLGRTLPDFVLGAAAATVASAAFSPHDSFAAAVSGLAGGSIGPLRQAVTALRKWLRLDDMAQESLAKHYRVFAADPSR